MFRLLFFTTLILLTACTKPMKISLIENDCIVKLPTYDSPFISFPSSFNKNSSPIKILATKDAMKKRIRVKNTNDHAIYFLDMNNMPFYLPENSGGSLWINETKESKALNNCVRKNKYSITIMQFENESLITINLYNGTQLKPNQTLDFDIHFEEEGDYKVALIYKGTEDEKISTWGLNKSYQLSTEVFHVGN